MMNSVPHKSVLKIASLVFFCVGIAGSLPAGPPYQTDDPEPPEPGQWELYCSAYSFAEARNSEGGAPQLEFNYGAAEDLQLSVSPQMAFFRPNTGPGAWGLGDTELGVKYRFLHEGESQPQAAFYPQIVLPSGDARQGLGNGRAQAFIPLWFQKSWGPWTSFGGGGYWINPGLGNENWTFIGAALQRDFGDHVSLGAELFFHSAAQTDDVDGLGSNLAFLYHFTPRDSLVFSAGRDIFVGDTTFTGYAGYQKLL